MELKSLSVKEFIDKVTGNDPVPGGGSVSALNGSLAASLAAMVANLTVGRKKYAEVNDEMEQISARMTEQSAKLLADVDRDAEAYDRVFAAFKLPKETDEEKAVRKEAIQRETKYAADVDKLGVKAYVDALKTANEKVDELLLTRTTDRGEQAAGALRAARRASDAAYIRLVKVVNALAILHNDTAKCDAFIKFMNAEIKHYREQSYGSPKKKDEPKKPADPKEPKDPKKPADPKDPKKPDAPKQPDEKPKPGGGDSGNPDITLPEE